MRIDRISVAEVSGSSLTIALPEQLGILEFACLSVRYQAAAETQGPVIRFVDRDGSLIAESYIGHVTLSATEINVISVFSGGFDGLGAQVFSPGLGEYHTSSSIGNMLLLPGDAVELAALEGNGTWTEILLSYWWWPPEEPKPKKSREPRSPPEFGCKLYRK